MALGPARDPRRGAGRCRRVPPGDARCAPGERQGRDIRPARLGAHRDRARRKRPRRRLGGDDPRPRRSHLDDPGARRCGRRFANTPRNRAPGRSGGSHCRRSRPPRGRRARRRRHAQLRGRRQDADRRSEPRRPVRWVARRRRPPRSDAAESWRRLGATGGRDRLSGRPRRRPDPWLARDAWRPGRGGALELRSVIRGEPFRRGDPAAAVDGPQPRAGRGLPAAGV